ncbi:hypothetical protein pEaSNUABM50_00097 [Erwinia phage pEa_SNUABM_50]|uniref:Uncharacterized protein n=4 Tax=Eneladusvirus BF TaxID=2560751 RepID=A0A7L8ZN22_9CAUD|nr:hypothetical protein FDH34_gp099 [Serratia phage BF]QOI71037.1 hypothetical protein pEaSNUABM12_00099 [Erwinia phage pEa_SNUABM_12]QOI71582.1 hypothetical protein pEaSNUABM47_00098 [Erwinia phage pEa_SNUABM_47]QOI72121.1 hypothetical protein pEaSNUABM50_00097 [Erwinia phage pEa_SNUABM_50]QXO11246.1 hypothetical protein pEaSNUABM19_00100 [Erwinia phage pEa_SNUABM_19]QXO11794.1 hypothetical protein pEaSNUABM44_00098 [Erwinia phage pEa_SNUABM_44]QXO12346.1 hypothetical protein pEaSNUABM49_001
MANNDQYKTGYDFFQKSTELLSPEQLKQMHPLFRRGYRTAQEDLMKKSNKTFPTVLSDIPRRPVTFVPDVKDILAATRRPRMNKLHLPQMEPILNLLVSSVEREKDKITRYADVVRLVDEKFNIILQYGYDSGVLNEHDLKQYNYDPK